MKYVCGFVFDNKGENVVLIQKTKFPPGVDWSANPLNGVGGKIEGLEAGNTAMAREFREEAGVSTRAIDWERFATLESGDYQILFYRMFNNSVFEMAQTKEAEEIVKLSVCNLSRVIPNLRWLIPMALDLGIHDAIVSER